MALLIDRLLDCVAHNEQLPLHTTDIHGGGNHSQPLRGMQALRFFQQHHVSASLYTVVIGHA